MWLAPSDAPKQRNVTRNTKTRMALDTKINPARSTVDGNDHSKPTNTTMQRASGYSSYAPFDTT
jgi:hypothetical protein